MANRSTTTTTSVPPLQQEQEQRAILAPAFAYHVHALLLKFAMVIIGTSFFTLLYFPSFISSLLCILMGFELKDLLGSNLRDFCSNVLLDNPSPSSSSKSTRHRSKLVYSSSESRLYTLYNLGIAIVVFSVVEMIIMMGLGIDSMVHTNNLGTNAASVISFVIVGGSPIVCILHIGFVTLVHHITYRCLNWPLVDPVPGALQGNTIGALVIVHEDNGTSSSSSSSSSTEINTSLNKENPLEDISLDLQKSLASLYQSFLATVSKVLFVTCLLFMVYIPSMVSAMIGIGISISLGNLTYSSSLQFWNNIQDDTVNVISRKLGRRARRCTCAIECCSSSILNIYNLGIALIVFGIFELLILSGILQNVYFSENSFSVFSWILWSYVGQFFIIVTYGSYAALLWLMIDQISTVPLSGTNKAGNYHDTNDNSHYNRENDDPSSGQSITSTIREWTGSTKTNNNTSTNVRTGTNDNWDTAARSPFVPNKNSYDAVPNYGSTGNNNNSNSSYSAPSYAQPSSSNDPPQFSSVRGGGNRSSNDAFVNQVMSLVNAKAGDVATEQDCKNLIPRIIASAEEVLERNGSTITDSSVNNLAERTVRAICTMYKVDMVTSNRLIALVTKN